VDRVDLNILVQEMIHLLAHTTLSRIQLSTDLAEPLGQIQGDPGALSHALINLCVNAVAAMPKGGQLVLRTRNLDAGWVQIDVEDTGTGMTREVQARAVDPFFTTKPQGQGTGLGLSMVYGTVQAHHGQLDIQSEPGRGTLVRMRFPVTQAPAPPPVQESREGGDLRGLRVLLVEDDELVRGSTLALLEVLGCETRVTASGEEALAVLEAGARPEVVILDLNMPGLGGAGTLPRLGSLRPGLPILLATGRVDQIAQNLAEQFPQLSLLPKPFGIKALQRLLAERGRSGPGLPGSTPVQG
jgi:CheY-like chemotaxis protein